MTDEPKQITKWKRFAESVVEHISNYVIPQYGDEGEEPAAGYSLHDCVKQAERYLARVGRKSREGDEERDLRKAAHWVQKAWERMTLPIPEGIYYNIETDNFYNMETKNGQGEDFWEYWHSRRGEFPIEPRS